LKIKTHSEPKTKIRVQSVPLRPSSQGGPELNKGSSLQTPKVNLVNRRVNKPPINNLGELI